MKRTLYIFIIAVIYSLPVNGQQKNLELSDIWTGDQFAAKKLAEVRSMKDGLHFTELTKDSNGQHIIKRDFRSGKVTDTLMRYSDFTRDGKSMTIDDYQLSPDESMLIIKTGSEPIYRHSTKANNYIYHLKTKDLSAVSIHGKQQLASLSPAGNMVAFVRDNNLFLSDIKGGNEKQITSDGKRNEIINGATDWVYEEEFSFDKGYQWSPDGKYIAYYRFDEREVKEFTLTYYGSLYPKEERYKYPKAGEANSTVEIHIYNVTTGKSVKADVNKEADQYIPRIKWTDDPSRLCVMRLNRLQNKVELFSCDAMTGSSTVFFTESNKAYIEIEDDFTFLKGNREFIWTSTIDGYNHIYLHNMDGTLKKQITSGKWDVTKFYGYDAASGNFYFQAAPESPMQKSVYATTLKGPMKKISILEGTNSATFSSNFKYYFIVNSGLHRPYKVSLFSWTGKEVREIENNDKVINAMSGYALTKPEFFQFTTSENIQLNGWMLKPPGFNTNTRYPVIQYMYGGPNSQTVKDEWLGNNYFWFQMLAQKGYIVVSVDNRGTGARGEEFNKIVYKNLGHYETIDQIEVAKWLSKQTYVDSKRIGAWGWSYGGYMTTLLMTKGADYFKAGVAVAPVTNWRFYDSIYTERYLQTPASNAKGYDDNSPINFTDKLKGKLLVIHGTADDNVHYQNSLEFVNALIKSNRQAETFFYPNKAHSISGVRLHQFDMMTQFFIENL